MGRKQGKNHRGCLLRSRSTFIPAVLSLHYRPVLPYGRPVSPFLLRRIILPVISREMFACLFSALGAFCVVLLNVFSGPFWLPVANYLACPPCLGFFSISVAAESDGRSRREETKRTQTSHFSFSVNQDVTELKFYTCQVYGERDLEMYFKS